MELLQIHHSNAEAFLENIEHRAAQKGRTENQLILDKMKSTLSDMEALIHPRNLESEMPYDEIYDRYLEYYDLLTMEYARNIGISGSYFIDYEHIIFQSFDGIHFLFRPFVVEKEGSYFIKKRHNDFRNYFGKKLGLDSLQSFQKNTYHVYKKESAVY